MFGWSGGVPTTDLRHSQHGCDLLKRGRGVVRQLLLPGSLAFTEGLFFFNKKRVRPASWSQWPEQPAGSARPHRDCAEKSARLIEKRFNFNGDRGSH